MKGPELEIEFSAYYNERKEKFDEGGLYPFLEYCQQSKPKDVMVRIDYDSPFEEIDVYCESLGISKLSYEKTDGHGSNFIARFTCDSKSGKPIMKVIYGLGKAGNGGHSYGFSVGDKKFYFDGDGADRITKINGVKFHSIKNTYDLGGVWNKTTKKNNEESNNDIMSKNVVKINEAQLRNLIKESVRKVLKESLGEISSDMIQRASNKFYQKYGGTMFPGPDAKDFPRDEHGNLLYPKDMKPLAQHYRNFDQAYKNAKYNEQFDDPITKQAMEIWNEFEGDVDWEITDDFGNEGCEVGGWLEADGWEFSASGYAEKAGGLDIKEIESVEFKSPDGQEGSFRP